MLTITKRERDAIADRLATFIKEYSETRVSKRQLAQSIGIERENIYNVINGLRSLTSGQYTLLLFRLMNEGIDLEEFIRSLIGEGEECIFSESSQSALQSQSLERDLVKRFRRKRQ